MGNEGKATRPLFRPATLVVGLIVVYQKWISPLSPRRCRFYPTCSEYARQALLSHGLLRGSLKAVRRITRCHPWNPGGYDPVN